MQYIFILIPLLYLLYLRSGTFLAANLPRIQDDKMALTNGISCILKRLRSYRVGNGRHGFNNNQHPRSFAFFYHKGLLRTSRLYHSPSQPHKHTDVAEIESIVEFWLHRIFYFCSCIELKSTSEARYC